MSPGGTRYAHAKRVRHKVEGHTDIPEGYALNVVYPEDDFIEPVATPSRTTAEFLQCSIP